LSALVLLPIAALPFELEMQLNKWNTGNMNTGNRNTGNRNTWMGTNFKRTTQSFFNK